MVIYILLGLKAMTIPFLINVVFNQVKRIKVTGPNFIGFKENFALAKQYVH